MILTDHEVERYARQVVMPEIGEAGQKRLLQAKVLILGAGGLGTPVIAGLAGAGVGHLTLMDDDVVELTNLNRQITHTMDRLGTNKAESAAVFAHELNPDISLQIEPQSFKSENA
ncbi:MAG: HesA/MoeB/ThiF family protein, partial [Candidatus Puniceispirillaceae bacterium]